jgi:hypothetical protein
LNIPTREKEKSWRMGKIQHLRIALNKPPNRPYLSGEILSGMVNMTVTDQLKIKNFKIVLSGKTHVQWFAFRFQFT